MKKVLLTLAAIAALVSCQSLKEEWQPVFTFGDNEPDAFVPYTEATLPGFSGEFTTIKALKEMYKTGGVELGNVWIKGQVISDDREGNVYRELYIQDATGGIDVKIGKSSLSSEFTRGQWVYVKCEGLTLGAYNGMPQLGLEKDQNSEYETSYIDLQELINRHVFRGEQATALAPAVVSEADIKAAIAAGFTGELWGKLVQIQGLKYGASSTYKTDNYKRIFILLYVDQYKDKKSGDNRVFCSQKTYGVNTWAMSKAKFLEYLDGGHFDECKTNGNLGMNDPFTAFDKDNTKTVKEMLREKLEESLKAKEEAANEKEAAKMSARELKKLEREQRKREKELAKEQKRKEKEARKEAKRKEKEARKAQKEREREARRKAKEA